MDPSDSDSQLSASLAPTPPDSLRSSDAAAALAALGRAFFATGGVPSQSTPVPPADQVLTGSSSSLSSLSGSDLGSCIPAGPADDDSALPTTMSPAMLMYSPPDLYHPHCPPYFPPPPSSSSSSANQPGAIMTPGYLGPNDHSLSHHHLRHISAGEDFDALSPMMGTLTAAAGLRTTSASSGSGMQTPQYGHSNVASPLVLHAHRRGAVSPPALPPSSVFLDAMARASASVATGGVSSVKGVKRVRGTPGAVSESGGSASSLEAEQHMQYRQPTVAAAAATGEGSRSAKRGPVTRRMAMKQQQPPAPVRRASIQEPPSAGNKSRRGIRRVMRPSATSEDDHDLSYPSSANTSPNSDALTLVPPTSQPHFTDDNLSSSSDDNNDDDDDDVFTDPESTPNRRRAARSSSSRRTLRASSTAPGPTTAAAAGDADRQPMTGLASALNDRLNHLESIIDLTALSAPPHMRDFIAQRRAFKATVNAVSAIVAEKLYKCRDMSLEDYFRTKFRISRAQVYRVVDSATVLRDLEELETTWDYARTVGNRARAAAVAANETSDAAAGEGDEGGNAPAASRTALFPLPVKQRVCAAIKSCAGNKQDRQELWKTLCMRVTPQAASSKDVKETWDWLVAQGRVTPKNGRRGSTVPPDLSEVMATAAAAVADASEAAAANAGGAAPASVPLPVPPPAMPPPRTKRVAQPRKRSAAPAAAPASVETAPSAGQVGEESEVANADRQQQVTTASANLSEVIELPPPAKRLRRSASMTALQAITTPAAATAATSQATPLRPKPKGTRRRPASLAPPAELQQQPAQVNPAPAQASLTLSPTVPSPSMSTLAALELAQSLGSPTGSPVNLQFPRSPPVGTGMMAAPAVVRPGHHLSLSPGTVSPAVGNTAFSASSSPAFFHPHTRSPPSVAPSNLLSPSISPSSLTMSAPLSPAPFATMPMLFTSASSTATSGSGAIPATLTGGPIKTAHASLIETAISTLQQLQDAGIQLEPCFNGTWVSGINQFRFRKHGEFVSAVHPHTTSMAATSSGGGGNYLGLHDTAIASAGGSPMLSVPGYAATSTAAGFFSPAVSSPSTHVPSITIPADDIAPAAMATSFASSPVTTGTRAASAGGMATANSPSVVQQHEAAMRLARLAAAAAAATSAESVAAAAAAASGGKLGRSDSMWSTGSPEAAHGAGSPMQVSPRVGREANGGEVGASQSR